MWVESQVFGFFKDNSVTLHSIFRKLEESISRIMRSNIFLVFDIYCLIYNVHIQNTNVYGRRHQQEIESSSTANGTSLLEFTCYLWELSSSSCKSQFFFSEFQTVFILLPSLPLSHGFNDKAFLKEIKLTGYQITFKLFQKNLSLPKISPFL